MYTYIYVYIEIYVDTCINGFIQVTIKTSPYKINKIGRFSYIHPVP